MTRNRCAFTVRRPLSSKCRNKSLRTQKAFADAGPKFHQPPVSFVQRNDQIGVIQKTQLLCIGLPVQVKFGILVPIRVVGTENTPSELFRLQLYSRSIYKTADANQ